MCPPDAYNSKKRICFFQVRFLMFLLCFRRHFISRRERTPARFPLFPLLALCENNKSGLQQVQRFPACLNCSAAPLPQAKPYRFASQRFNWYFPSGSFRKTGSVRVPANSAQTPRSRPHSPRSSPGRSTGRRLRSHLLASVPNRSCIASSVDLSHLVDRSTPAGMESPIARCTGSTK